MRTSTLTLVSVLIVTSLVGCASLPVPGPSPAKYLAVYFEPGTSSEGVSHYVETWNTPAPVRLRAGLNYIPVPADVVDEMVTDFFVDSSSNGMTFRMMTKSVYQRVSIPEAGTIVLVPLVLKSKLSKASNGTTWVADISPLPAAKIQAIFEEWKKDKNAAGWPNLIVAEVTPK